MGGSGRVPGGCKSGAGWSSDTESAAMERPHFPLAMGLGLLAFCLLTLSPDARAELRSRRTGERQNLSPDDPRVLRAAQAAVASYNMDSNSLYYFRDTKVIDAKYQVRLLGQSDCGEGEKQFGEGEGQRTGDKRRAAWLDTKHKGALKPTITPGPFYEILQNKEIAKPPGNQRYLNIKEMQDPTSFSLTILTSLTLPGVGGPSVGITCHCPWLLSCKTGVDTGALLLPA